MFGLVNISLYFVGDPVYYRLLTKANAYYKHNDQGDKFLTIKTWT